MKTSRHIVRFYGGPSDGLVLNDPHFRVREKLQLPSSPVAVRFGRTNCYELFGHWSAAYLLTTRYRAIEDGRATTCLRYSFLGYEMLDTPAELESPRRSASSRPARLGRWFCQILRSLRKWSLEPIDGPVAAARERAVDRAGQTGKHVIQP